MHCALAAIALLCWLLPAAAAADDAHQGIAFMERLAALGDRSTGSEGCRQAADIVEEAFRALAPEGAAIGRQSFSLPIRSYTESHITLTDSGERHAIQPFLGNALSPGNTPSGGLEGELVYVGDGELDSMDGMDLQGAIAVMDMDSGKQWINAAALGARGLIYIDDSTHDLSGAPYPRGRLKAAFESAPVDFPRFWVPMEQANQWFGDISSLAAPAKLGRARLACDAAWRRIQTENVYCLIPGTDPEKQEELLVVEAFYDSESSIPGAAPGADEAASIASLMDLAANLGKNPPARNVMLVAASGHGQFLAGQREFVWATQYRKKLIRSWRQDVKSRLQQAKKTVALLISTENDPLEVAMQAGNPDVDPEDANLIYNALQERLKDAIDDLTKELFQLRMAEKRNEKLIKKLAARRMYLKRLSWNETYEKLKFEEKETLRELLPAAQERAQLALTDLQEQMEALDTSYKLRNLTQEYRVVASVSLHLSGNGEGVGAFQDGWLYYLRDRINKTRAYPHIDKELKAVGEQFNAESGKSLFRDTLRLYQNKSAASYLPDRPPLGGEVAALAGLPGLTLCTVYDARPLWTTPYDTSARLNKDYLELQGKLVMRLLRALSDNHLKDTGYSPREGFSVLYGKANMLRQGELFPDKPAAGTVLQVYQGWATWYYVMVDHSGAFYVPGMADKKHVQHKAIIEGNKFDEAGKPVWAIDKEMTGKSNYRVKMQRKYMETELIMFDCGHISMFNLLEPRTFNYLTKIDLLDAARDASPLRYWYSRLDTWSSSMTSIFMPPASRMKATFSDNYITRKMLLLNSRPDEPTGVGFPLAGDRIVEYTEHQAAWDMWSLLGPRIDTLERHGIVNEMIRNLYRKGKDRLQQSGEQLANLNFSDFFESARSSWAMAVRVYAQVEQTQKDVLLGVLFYVALFVPFAYCMERFLFSFVDIKKRIIGFLGLLLAVIGIVYSVHPAFQLTYSPAVVILAFFILALSVMVSLIIFFRFEKEMIALQRRSRHQQAQQAGHISSFKAFAAAFAIGVTNLRRRRLRTVLTCLTLIILTFTIMNFTTVKSTREYGKNRFSDTASYRGLLLRTFTWLDLPREALSFMRNGLDETGKLAPRVWFENEDKSQPLETPIRLGRNTELARGVIGLSHTEPEVTGMDTVLAEGRWLAKDAGREIILPSRMAAKLGVDLNDAGANVVHVWGMDFTVVGLTDEEKLRNFVDLDGEPLSPVTFPTQYAERLSDAETEAIESGENITIYSGRYEHVNTDVTVYVSAHTLLSMGGEFKALAVKPGPDKDMTTVSQNLSDRYGLLLYTGDKNGTFLTYASDSINYSGVGTLIIPMCIAVLIVLNTMIGSVYERKNEIAVYTSVGLAPSHVSILFIAEAMAMAVISVVIGYLLAQTSAFFLAGTAIWEGMTVNYSSLAGVGAMLLVIAVVLVSVIYPSKLAADIAIPDVNRSWSMPDPKEDQLIITLPFLVKMEEQICAGGFLLDYYQAHFDVSHGLFSINEVETEYACPIDKPDGVNCITLRFMAWMAPFDFGVRQRVQLSFCESENYPGYLEIEARLHREAGEEAVWHRLNKAFINDMRKQLLFWRSLEPESRRMYEQQMEAAYGGTMD